MFNNAAIDVAIGLIFIYLLYSLLATILMEFIARWFGIRQRFLVRTIRRMLEDYEGSSGNSFRDFLMDTQDSLTFFFRTQFRKDRSFAKAFYHYPLIKYLSVSRVNNKPSYISPDTFSQTLTALLRGESTDTLSNPMMQIRDTLFGESDRGFAIEPETRSYLQKLWLDASGDIARFRAALEHWFNETNERSEGGYKRITQTILFVVGLGFAVGFNVDTIAIARLLVNNNTLSRQVADIAERNYPAYGQMAHTLAMSADSGAGRIRVVMPSAAAVPDTAMARMNAGLEQDALELQGILGLGWNTRRTADTARIVRAMTTLNTALTQAASSYPSDRNQLVNRAIAAQEVARQEIALSQASGFGALPQDHGWPTAIVGWLITAFALCLGAPFWFDLLNKIMMLRVASRKAAAERKDGTAADGTIPANQRVG